jgi:hypothetical protein
MVKPMSSTEEVQVMEQRTQFLVAMKACIDDISDILVEIRVADMESRHEDVDEEPSSFTDTTAETIIAAQAAVVAPCKCLRDSDDCDSLHGYGEWGCDSPGLSSSSFCTRTTEAAPFSWFPLSRTLMSFWWLCMVPPVLTSCVFPLELAYGCSTCLCKARKAESQSAKGTLTMDIPITPVATKVMMRLQVT